MCYSFRNFKNSVLGKRGQAQKTTNCFFPFMWYLPQIIACTLSQVNLKWSLLYLKIYSLSCSTSVPPQHWGVSKKRRDWERDGPYRALPVTQMFPWPLFFVCRPSLNSKQQIQTAANWESEGTQKQRTQRSETIVRWDSSWAISNPKMMLSKCRTICQQIWKTHQWP